LILKSKLCALTPRLLSYNKKKFIDDVDATWGSRVEPTIIVAPSGMFSMTITEISLRQPIKQQTKYNLGQTVHG
jgi:hypothetical protein